MTSAGLTKTSLLESRERHPSYLQIHVFSRSPGMELLTDMGACLYFWTKITVMQWDGLCPKINLSLYLQVVLVHTGYNKPLLKQVSKKFYLQTFVSHNTNDLMFITNICLKVGILYWYTQPISIIQQISLWSITMLTILYFHVFGLKKGAVSLLPSRICWIFVVHFHSLRDS